MEGDGAGGAFGALDGDWRFWLEEGACTSHPNVGVATSEDSFQVGEDFQVVPS